MAFLPTDNLYKFSAVIGFYSAILGIIAILLGNIFTQDELKNMLNSQVANKVAAFVIDEQRDQFSSRLNQEDMDDERKARIMSLYDESYIYPTNKWQVDTQSNDLLSRAFSSVNDKDAIDKANKIVIRIGWIVLIIGGLFLLAGMALWYIKAQQFEDQKISS